MTKRLALTPAVGLFAGLSVVSYGALSMFLTGVHGARPMSATSCSPPSAARAATATTRAMVRPVGHAGAQAQRRADMPVLLSDNVRLVAASRQAGTQEASQSSPPLPSTQSSPSTSQPPLPQPSPGSSATPGASGLPQPGPATTTASSQPITPGGPQASPTATATATPTTTATPTPTNTPTTPPPATLCMTMQTLGDVSAVDPHTKIVYAIWIWLTSGTNGTAKIKLAARPTSVRPTFSVCSTTGASSCTVGGLSAGQRVEVQAKLAAPKRSAKRVTLTATATSAQAANSASASATVDIKPDPAPSPTPTPNPYAGYGGTLPGGQGLPGGTTIPGLGIQPTGNLGSAFPQVSPSASLPGGRPARHGHSTRTIDLSAGLPLDVRLIGGQVIGLAVLAAAVTIAVARLSLRRQPARHGDDGGTGT